MLLFLLARSSDESGGASTSTGIDALYDLSFLAKLCASSGGAAGQPTNFL
jgi:hypothetical protein